MKLLERADRALIGASTCIGVSLTNMVTVFAEGEGNSSKSYRTVEGMINEAKTGTGAAAASELEEKSRQMGVSAYTIAFTICIVIALITILICGVYLMMAPAQERNEAKEKVKYAFIGAVVVGGASALLLFASSIGSTLFKTKNTEGIEEIHGALEPAYVVAYELEDAGYAAYDVSAGISG